MIRRRARSARTDPLFPYTTLFRSIGSALRLLARAEILSAPRALEWGLLDAVADDGQPFEAFVDAYVAGFSERTPDVMRAFTALAHAARSAERRVGNEGVSTCRSGWWPER